MMLFMATSKSALQTSVPDDMRRRVMGVWAPIFGGMMHFGSLVSGGLTRKVGMPGTIIFGAIICIIAAAVTLCVVQRRDRSAEGAKAKA